MTKEKLPNIDDSGSSARESHRVEEKTRNEGEEEINTNRSEGEAEINAKEGDCVQEEPKIDSESEDDDDEEQPIQPEGMFFGPREYTKTCKVGTRCQVYHTVKLLKTFEDDLPWFQAHSQFSHVFHMPEEERHMNQGLWMLLLRTARIETDRECWFVVNGVPIRYSIKEHALLSGFKSHEYPKEFHPNMTINEGDLKFAKKMFPKNKKGIKSADVEAKLVEMKDCAEKKKVDRKKLAILLFLSKVVVVKAKADGNIDRFLLKIVEDVHACETFPWGRLSFEVCMEGIKSVLTNMKGSVNEQTTLAGFILPLKILAFEAIPHLGEKFRESVRFKKECPRMCQGKFSKTSMRGFTLDEINEELGDVKDICSILEPNSQEKDMLRRIVDDDADEGIGFIDPVVDSWRTRLITERKTIFWKEMYDQDVRSRRGELMEEENLVPDKISLKEAMDKGFERMDKGFERILEKLGEHDKRIVSLEASVSLLSRQDKTYVDDVNVNDQEPMVSHGVDVRPPFVEQTVADFNDQEPMVSHGENVDVTPFDDVDTSVVEACTDLVLYVQKDVENETEASEAVEGNHETPEKEMKKKEIKKKEVKKKEVKKKETKKQGKMIEDVDADEKPGGKRVRKESIHQKAPYTAEKKKQNFTCFKYINF